METIEIFRNHGLDVSKDIAQAELAERLGKLPNEELLTILDDFIGDENISVDTDETMQTLTLSRALVTAFKEGKNSITQADIDAASEHATRVSDDLSTPADTDTPVVETPETPVVATEDTQAPAPKPAKRITLKATIKDLVEHFPDAQSHEIVNMALEQDDSHNPTTGRMYYYQIRTELGMPTIGKRGRKPSDTFNNLKNILKDNLDKPKADMVTRFVDEFELTPGTASAYYSKAKTELKLES